MNLGSAYQENRQFSKAIKQFKKVLKVNPMNSTAHNNIGVCSFIHNEKKSDVRSSFLEAMCLDPF